MEILTIERVYIVKILRIITLTIVCLLLTAFSLKAEDKPLPESQEKLYDMRKELLGFFDIYSEEEAYKRRRYRAFLDIKIFDKQATNVWITGHAKKIGLDEKELTDYLRLKIKNNFANIKIEKDWGRPDNKYTAKQIGAISLGVWIVGDNYPVAYHLRYKFIKLEAGTKIWDTERLGYGSKDSVPDSIKEDIDKTIEDLAIFFFKARGEL